MPRSSKWCLSLRYPHQNPVCTSSLPHTCHMPRPSSWFSHPDNILKKMMNRKMCYWKSLRHFFKSRGFIAWNQLTHWSWLLNKLIIATMTLGSTQPLTEMSSRNISWGGGGGKGGRCVGLTTLPPSRADCLEIWEPQSPGALRACPGLCRDCFVHKNSNIYITSFYIHK
jgi:hypothetical protein